MDDTQRMINQWMVSYLRGNGFHVGVNDNSRRMKSQW
jgi:hypothetical protein